jgi:hypothetical protein
MSTRVALPVRQSNDIAISHIPYSIHCRYNATAEESLNGSSSNHKQQCQLHYLTQCALHGYTPTSFKLCMPLADNQPTGFELHPVSCNRLFKKPVAQLKQLTGHLLLGVEAQCSWFASEVVLFTEAALFLLATAAVHFTALLLCA